MIHKLQVLIPTYNKSIEEIKSLCHFWKLQSDALVSVQSDSDFVTTFDYQGFCITVIFNKTKGVSCNRNILLKAFDADIGVFIDDDCSLVDGYTYKIDSFFTKYGCDCACFNGFLPDEHDILIHRSRTKRVKKFSDVSSVGAPGIAFTKTFVQTKTIFFDETLGTPNFIVLGEDSKFVSDICKTNSIFFRSSEPVFKIEEDLKNSSYFRSFADCRFLISKGFVVRTIFSSMWLLRNIFYSYKLSKKTKLPFPTVFFYMNCGAKYKTNKNRKILKLANDETLYAIKFHKRINSNQYRTILENYYLNNNLDVIISYLHKNNIDFKIKIRKF